MSEGMNKVMLLGRVGDQPELRYGGDKKTAVLRLRLATTEAWNDKDGTVKERTAWHTVVLFGSRAEAMSQRLVKGSLVFVEGYLQSSSFEKDGVKRWKTEVVARDAMPIPERARSLEPLEEEAALGVEARAASDESAHGPKNGAARGSLLHDEIPF